MATDPELLASWRDGDADAGHTLFQRYFEPIARFFANKLVEDHDDLIQETFMACVKGRDRMRSDGSFRSYLFSVAFNVLKGYYRSKRAADRFEALGSASVYDLSPGPSTVLGAGEQEQLLLDALRRIPIDLQVALEMRYWEDMTSTEIGEALELPATTIRSRLFRGREQLERAIALLPASPRARETTIAELERWAGQIRSSMAVAEDPAHLEDS